ncbi:hypothetical protein Tco_1486697, partial [Tanacetum coccineum]
MEKYVSTLLKKAGELMERADEVLDEGLENNLMDSGLIELKELKNQLFAVYGSPTGYAELQDKVWEEWHRLAEHIPTRLNFDEADDIDLNVTQPPTTQRQVVGGAEDENNMEEEESLLDAIRNYVSQETTEEDEAMVPSYSQPKPLNVLLGNFPYGRPKRHVVLPEVLCSPYVVKKVSLICGISSHERRAANCLFSARLTETNIVFKMSHVDEPRSILERLYLRLDIASGAIDLFTHVSNEADKRKNIYFVNRLFCHTAML